MKPNSILILGCGDLGVRTGTLMMADGHPLAGVCRTPDRLPAGFEGYAGDYCVPGSLAFLEAVAPDLLIATLKPVEFSAQGYQLGFVAAVQNLLTGLGSHRPKLILMVSSTRVFAEENGGWVDEKSALAQRGFAATAIVEAEQMLQNSGHSTCIVRFGGIYGDPRGRLLSRIARGEPRAEQPLIYGNRIHRDDCAGFMAHLLNLDAIDREPVYIGVDSEPAPRLEVERWLAAEMGVPVNGEDDSGATPVGGKRCSNKLMLQSGYSPLYRDYRQGYSAVLAAGV